MLQNPILEAVLALAGLVVGYFARQFLASRSANSLENKLKEETLRAKQEAQDVLLKAKNKAVSFLEEAKQEDKERKVAIERLEERLIKRDEEFAKRENELRTEKSQLASRLEGLEQEKESVQKIREKTQTELSKIAGLTKEEAKEKLLKEIQEENRDELSETLQKVFHDRQEEIEKKTMEIITTSIQRYARANVSDITTSVFTLPSEDLKGKIIGREGRNIRTLERLTGTELIIDETPDTIIISSFDPLRREIARLSLLKLIKDGRIQPAKIEEKVEEAKNEVDKRMHELGEEAAYEVGAFNLPKEIIQLLGRLYFRTSFGQNVLTHSVEMAHISGMIAAELGINVEVAKKGALLHDIGKAIDHEVQGTHVELGRKILKKYGIEEKVIAAMQSHHDEFPYASPESYVVTAADILSAARPGVRRGTLENYIKRLEDLEKIASSFPGVKNSYAISAGRELRVFVIPEKIDDFGALNLAKNIATKIQSELKYPGEIKVNVIRELRAVEYAK